MCITRLFDWFNKECLVLFSTSEENEIKNESKNKLIIQQPKNLDDTTWDIL